MKNACNHLDRDTKCGDCGTPFLLIRPDEYAKLKEDKVALEATRADLWGVNEELRNKIKCLEEGQLEIQDRLASFIK